MGESECLLLQSKDYVFNFCTHYCTHKHFSNSHPWESYVTQHRNVIIISREWGSNTLRSLDLRHFILSSTTYHNSGSEHSTYQCYSTCSTNADYVHYTR